jgi:hypothetical protein
MTAQHERARDRPQSATEYARSLVEATISATGVDRDVLYNSSVYKIEATVCESGAIAFLRKPVDNADLDAALHAAISAGADGNRFWGDALPVLLSHRVEEESR